jgi:hypothetical protein
LFLSRRISSPNGCAEGRTIFRDPVHSPIFPGLSVSKIAAFGRTGTCYHGARMSETPKEGSMRREEAIQEVEELRKKIADKREELQQIRERFREALKRTAAPEYKGPHRE